MQGMAGLAQASGRRLNADQGQIIPPAGCQFRHAPLGMGLPPVTLNSAQIEVPARRDGDVDTWRGVPFAAAPVGIAHDAELHATAAVPDVHRPHLRRQPCATRR